jgi:hypothetical protein
MAEKRKAGFNIPLNFYDGPEVDSIPKRIRAAAIGVWALAGDYAATQLTDGYVGPGLLKQFGCTDAIRAALKVTINKKGELSPLWVDARNGGVQLTNWPKHQRTNDEVTTYRESEAERKRIERESKRSSSTSVNGKTSGRTPNGQNPDVRPDAGDPKTKTETKTDNGHLGSSAYESDGARERDNLSPPVNVGATRLVERAVPANAVNAATRTGLRIEASQLLTAGESETDVDACLRIWLTKPDLGVKALKSLMAEVYKTRNGAAVKPPNKIRGYAELAQEIRAQEHAQLDVAARKELT